MKKALLMIALMMTLSLTGCSWLAVNLTPSPVIDGVARGGAVARIAEKDVPQGEDLQEYLKLNRQLWEQLEVWFELRALNNGE